MSDRNRILCEFRNKTKSIMGDSLKQMILYGSYARGDYKKNSDIDIMILTDFNDEEIVKYRELIWNITYDLELENDIIISSILRNIDKFNHLSNILPFYTNVNTEGIVLSD